MQNIFFPSFSLSLSLAGFLIVRMAEKLACQLVREKIPFFSSVLVYCNNSERGATCCQEGSDKPDISRLYSSPAQTHTHIQNLTSCRFVICGALLRGMKVSISSKLYGSSQSVSQFTPACEGSCSVSCFWRLLSTSWRQQVASDSQTKTPSQQQQQQRRTTAPVETLAARNSQAQYSCANNESPPSKHIRGSVGS